MALLANPRDFNGKLIRVKGYFDGSHHEDCRLFLSKEDFDYYIARNSIYVRWDGCLDRRASAKMQRRHATVEGVFQADIGSDFGSFSAIREVRSLRPLESRAAFKERISASWWLQLWPWLPLGTLFTAATSASAYFAARRIHRR